MPWRTQIAKSNLCIFPWIHLNLWPDGNVTPCCISDWRNPVGNVKDNTLDQIMNNDSMKSLRRQFLNNEKPAQCERCWEREDVGLSSVRQFGNNLFKNELDNIVADTDADCTLHDFKLRYWDFRFSNLCNMKCRSCGPGLSSLWFNDAVDMGLLTTQPMVLNANAGSKENLLDTIDKYINDVKYVYFAGGEPLISDEHYYILNKLIEHGRSDVILRYNSNVLKLQYRDHNLPVLWSNFDTVLVDASIDNVGKRAEYIRSGTKWGDVAQNLMKLNKLPNVTLGIDITMSIMNVLTIDNLMKTLNHLGIEYNQMHVRNILQSPLLYNIKTAPDDMKDVAKERMTTLLAQIPNRTHAQQLSWEINPAITFMQHDIPNVELHRQEFIEQTIALDKLRNEDIRTTLPELMQYYKFPPKDLS